MGLNVITKKKKKSISQTAVGITHWLFKKKKKVLEHVNFFHPNYFSYKILIPKYCHNEECYKESQASCVSSGSQSQENTIKYSIFYSGVISPCLMHRVLPASVWVTSTQLRSKLPIGVWLALQTCPTIAYGKSWFFFFLNAVCFACCPEHLHLPPPPLYGRCMTSQNTAVKF